MLEFTKKNIDMKLGFLLLVTMFFSITSCKSQAMKIMSYNIRLDLASDGENAWANRKDFFNAQLQLLEPDIVGMQEVRPSQIKDLNTSLIGYAYIGKGRDGGGEGEHTAIYYNEKNVKVEHENTFWLSETPEKMSMGWDAAYPRICTYGLFTYKASKQKVWVFNTHLDHIGPMAQKEGIKLVLEQIKTVNVKNYPVVLMGDLNSEPDSEVYKSVIAVMSDAKEMAKLQFGPNGTFNGFQYDEPVTRRIDYIFLSNNSNLSVEKYAVFSSSVDFKFPSDHFPVFVTLQKK